MRPSLTLSATASVAFTLFALLLAPALPAQAVTLLRDVNPYPETPQSSVASEIFDISGRLLFVADTPQYGDELWVTDGTSAGTRLLLEINPGPMGAAVLGMRSMGQFVLFRAYTWGQGVALWRSDGTAAGTQRLVSFDMSYERHKIEYRHFALYKGLYLFRGSDAATGIEPWVSDGTTAGTRILADLKPGPESSDIWTIDVYDKGFILAVSEQYPATLLYVSDGTGPGTRLVKSFASLTQPTMISRLEGDGQRFYFAVDGTAAVRGIWICDGTAAGVQRLSGTTPDQDPLWVMSWVMYRGMLVFCAEHAVHGQSLFVSDGTKAGTRFLVDLDVTSRSGDVREYWSHGGLLWFPAETDSEGSEIWKTDGTALGTQIALRRAAGPEGFDASYRGHLGDEFLFQGRTDRLGLELYVSDGTMAGTRLFADLALGSASFRSSVWKRIGSRYFFSADDGLTGGEPWISDGTPAGTKLIADLAPGAGNGDSLPGPFVSAGGVSWFTAWDARHGSELRRTDGSATGTVLTEDLHAGPVDSAKGEIAFLGGRVFLNADDGRTGAELWAYDPARGYQQVVDLQPGEAGSNPSHLTPFGKKLFFFAETSSTSGLLPFVTDGTPRGTQQLTSFTAPLRTKKSWQRPVVLGDRLFFVGADEPYVTDGSPQGTTRLGVPGASASDRLASFGDRLLVVSGPESQARLFLTDGSSAGTVALTPTGVYVAPKHLVACSPSLAYFNASSPNEGGELWTTDGTPAGTRLVADLVPGPKSAWPTELTAFGDRVLFVPSGFNYDLEPWISDGTQQGTMQLGDLHPADSSRPEQVKVAGEYAYFLAEDGTPGLELWRTDGTPKGTVLIRDIDVLHSIGEAKLLGQAGGRLALRYPDKQWGNEPFVLEDKATVWPVGEPCGPLTLGLRGLAAPTLGGSARYEFFAAAPQQPLVLLFGAPSPWPLPWFSEECVAHFDPATIFLVDTSVGTGSRTLPIPAVQSLLGVRFVTQCFTVNGQPLRLSSSAGLLQLIGH